MSRVVAFAQGAARGAQLLPLFSIFLAALTARLAAIGRYVTPDELNWVYRSLGLRRALLAGDWRETIQSGHPGVTTTWIGAASAQLQQWLQPELGAHLAWLDGLQQLSTDNVEAYRHLYAFLNGGRLGVALITSLGIVLMFLLARELIGSPAAMLGAVLLALDPFFAGLSGLLHVDSLLATFTLLALLLALRAGQTGSRRMALAAGLFTALALLTKTPGLILLAFVPLILLLPPHHPLYGRFANRPWQLFAWAAALALTTLLLLPALWVDPRHVLEVVGGLSGRLVEDAVRPTFFMGRTALDHGPLFYPVVVFFRLSPVAFAGLAISLPALLKSTDRTGKAAVLKLLLFALLFLVAVSLAAKKFDRYALPSLVVLTFVGGWGLAQAAGSLRAGERRRSPGRWLLAGAALLQLLFLAASWPHPLTAYNWLVGGNSVAQRVFPAGWGEDAGQAARELSASLEQPQEATLFTSSLTGAAPFFAGDIVPLREPNLTRLQPQDFVLSLAQDRQLQPIVLPAESRVRELSVKGLGKVTLHSDLQAGDFDLPSFSFQQRDLRFGPALQLAGAGGVFLSWPQESVVGLIWQRTDAAALSPAYRLQLQLLNDRGQVWLQREMPLLNRGEHAPRDWLALTPQTVFYAIQAPPTLAPGDYEIVARLFDDLGQQQGVFRSSGAFAGTQASVAQVRVTAPPSQPALDIPQPIEDSGSLVGYGELPQTVVGGDPLTLDLWWRAQQATELEIILQLGEAPLPLALETEGWRAGQIYQIRPTWRLPPDLTAGRQTLSLVALGVNGQRQLAELGQVNVENRQRQYDLPPELEPLQVQVGDLALLQAVSVEIQDQNLLVHVIWQAEQTTFENYTTFVHLRDGERVIGGDDRQPSPPTSRWARGEVIVESYTLPRPAPGAYAVALGLYDAAGGDRLPMRNADDQILSDDQYLLPVVVP